MFFVGSAILGSLQEVGGDMSKFLIAMSLAFVWTFQSISSTVDVYDFKARINVPRVYDNANSEGYRKFQMQTLEGRIEIEYGEEFQPSISLVGLVNKTHKVNGENVTYKCLTNDERLYRRMNFIGSNKTGKFRTPAICIFVEAYPSYAVESQEEDNSLYFVMSGKGSSTTCMGARIPKTIRGNIAGTIGCGCTGYGHISPTRVLGKCGVSELVDDVCPLYGTFIMKYNKKESTRPYCAILCR